MHNEEGTLFDLVFHKLLALGVVLIAVAALVWIIWATVRAGAITRDASQPEAPADAGSSMLGGPGEAMPLANSRAAAHAGGGTPHAMVKLLIRPLALLAARAADRLDRLPQALARAAADAAFFAGGPS